MCKKIIAKIYIIAIHSNIKNIYECIDMMERIRVSGKMARKKMNEYDMKMKCESN